MQPSSPNAVRKWTLCLAAALLSSGGTSAWAAPTTADQAARVAAAFLRTHAARFEGPAGIEILAGSGGRTLASSPATLLEIRGDGGRILAYVQEMAPQGFIIVAGDDRVSPILGYSFKGAFPSHDSPRNALLHLVRWDMAGRLAALDSLTNAAAMPEGVAAAGQAWTSTLNTPGVRLMGGDPPPQQWPSNRDGWLATDWDQGTPYNDVCPFLDTSDPARGRCAVGCVATALSQILNYWKYPHAVEFDYSDRYESKGAMSGNRSAQVTRFWIDDDHAARGFPSFEDLNTRLSTLSFEDDDAQLADLCFAAGIKVRMDYGLQSGALTSRAGEAFRDGFGYGSAVVASDSFSSSAWNDRTRPRVIANLKEGWPVQMGIRGTDPADGHLVGHSVVIDGYCTDGTFHINFGWDAAATTWYALPTLRAPFDTIHTVVYDIAPYRGWGQDGADERNTYRAAYVGPRDGNNLNMRWNVSVTSGRVQGLVVTLANKTCIAVTARAKDAHSYIRVIDPYGSELRTIQIPDIGFEINKPVLNSRGELFVGSQPVRDGTVCYVYRVNVERGTVARIFEAPRDQMLGDYLLKIDPDDTLYVPATYGVYALRRDGSLKWYFAFPPRSMLVRGLTTDSECPAISVDTSRNNVYVSSYGTYNPIRDYVACLNRDTGEARYVRTFENIQSAGDPSPAAIGDDGALYLGVNTSLLKIRPNAGNTGFDDVWTLDLFPSLIPVPPAIGPDGTLYLAVWKANVPARIGFLAINHQTKAIKWQDILEVGDVFDNADRGYVDREGKVYFYKWVDKMPTLYCYRDEGDHGTRLWEKTAPKIRRVTAFGPGLSVYLLADNVVSVLTEGATGDPEGGGMDFTDNQRPQEPTLLGPLDGTTGVGSRVTLSWECLDPDSHATRSAVFLCPLIPGQAADFLLVTNVPTGTAVTLEQLPSGVRYLWKVLGTDGQALSEGPSWSFSTSANHTATLGSGDNLVSLPFEDSSVTDAEGLLSRVSHSIAVSGWNVTEQRWQQHVRGGLDNFPLVPGDACLVRVTAGSVFEQFGVWSAPSFELQRGYNLITLPRSEAGLGDAEQLARRIPTCTGVWEWSPAQQAWSGHAQGGPNRFPVAVGQPYLVWVSTGSVWP